MFAESVRTSLENCEIAGNPELLNLRLRLSADLNCKTEPPRNSAISYSRSLAILLRRLNKQVASKDEVRLLSALHVLRRSLRQRGNQNRQGDG